MGDLQVKTPFACPDLPDAFDELIEVVLAEAPIQLPKFIIKDEPFDDELLKSGRSPDPKLGCLFRINTIANSDNCIERVMVELALDTSSAFILNYPEFPDS